MATTCKLISKQILSSTAASVTFSSIPQTYTDLLLVTSLATSRLGLVYNDVRIRFNGATSDTNHSSRYLFGNGSTVASGSEPLARGPYATGANATANTFASSELYIPNYASTTTNKSSSIFTAVETNASSAPMLVAANLWASTSAITSFEIIPDFVSFLSGSSFFLYGISKA